MASPDTLSPTRLATRWLQAREHNLRNIEIRYEQLRLAIEQLEIALQENARASTLQSKLQWIKNYVSELVEWIAQTRAIPSGKAKVVELALRAANSPGKPRDVPLWWAKNKKFFDLIMLAQKWPEKGSADSSEQQEVFQVGPFEVHNTLHLTGDRLEKISEVLEKASAAIKRSKASFARVLYGPVFVVGRLEQSKLAWYNIRGDDVYLRAHTKVGRGELHNLVHELGHRYWYKFMSSTQRLVWKQRHAAIARTTPHVELPKAGEVFPIPFKEHPGLVVTVTDVGVDAREPGNLVIHLSNGGYVKVDSYRRLMEKINAQKEFPTPYASTSAEEFFAESFAMHVLGELQPQHEEFFVENVP